MAVLTSLHVFAIAYFDWSTAARWTGLKFIPVMTTDIAVMMAIIYFLYRAIYGTPNDVVAVLPDERRYSERDVL